MKTNLILAAVAYLPASAGVARLRHLHLRPDALAAHVDEHLVALVGARPVDVRLRLPRGGHGHALQAMSWLFPLRHSWMLYQATVLNGFPVIDVWFHLIALIAFTLLPWFVLRKVKNAMLNDVYIP